MKDIKKLMITLVALFAISTGAWAEEKMVTINSSTMSSGAVTATGFNIILETNLYVNFNPATITTSEGVITKLVIKKSDVYVDAFTEANVGVTPGTITYGSDEITVTDINAESVTLSRKGGDNWSTSSVDVYYASASGPEVAWDKTAKTGTFTMPGGNVELEPEYYTQATAAEGAVTAATDVKATTDAPLVTIDDTKLTGAAKMMYYVSTDATAPAYDAEGWTDELPTAEKFTEAGNVNVWYYPVGTDENVGGATATYSDGDMNAKALAVTIAAAPTYAVTFADDLAEPTLWTATPNTGLKQGDNVTVTYTGSKKVIGVKAEKIGGAEGHALSASAVGEIVGSDGKAYAVADKDNLPSGVTAVAMVAYKSGSNGLAIQLNASPVEKNWADAKTYAEGLTAVPGGTWRLPSKVDWQNMFVGCAVSGDASAGDNMSPIAGFKAKIAATGITWLSADYWSSTESGEYASTVGVNLNGSNPRAEFTEFTTSIQIPILGCLAF